MKTNSILVSLVLGASLAFSAQAADNNLVIQTKKVGAPISSTQYGIFFEDINFAADGGLYAEMIKNRSFEFPQNLMGWTAFGKFQVLDQGGPFDKNPHYVRLIDPGHREKRTGIENEGFFGIAVKQDATYRFSVWARVPEGGKGLITVQLVDNYTMGEHQEFNSHDVVIEGKDWKKYTLEIKSNRTFDNSHLRIFLSKVKGEPMRTIDLEHVSLFPTDTWKGRENGMRKDLAQALADLKPGVFRFPGGCIVEGTELETRYQWKNTVGPVENRPLNENRWENTFPYRLYPEYHQSYGLGFYEFFQLCEDFGAEPLPVISCGLSCQFQNDIKNEAHVHVALEDLGPYIQDALDLVEFANGDVNTKWGKVRADMGHPEPFNLKYLGVGNEQWDYNDNPAFTSRLKLFSDALRKAYPDLKLIGTTGPNSEGWDFDLLQPRMKELKVDLYDEHYYRNEEWFLSHGLRYDSYDRKGPKIFAGEYACHGANKHKWNHYWTSILEAAHMTGIERNADIVTMATYAPLFAHVKGWQWRPDMIWFDNTQSWKTVSYYVQQLYCHYKGSNVLSLTMDKKPVAGQEGQNGLFASAVLDKESNSYIVKVVNTSKEPQTLNFQFQGLKKGQKFSAAKVIKLSSTEMDADNIPTVENGPAPAQQIVPVETTLDPATTSVVLEPQSFGVYIFTK